MTAALLIATIVLVVIGYATYRLIHRGQRDEADRAERGEQREQNEYAHSRQGQPLIEPQGGSGGPDANAVHHEYKVSNGGPAAISELRLWIEDSDGRTVSAVAGGATVVVPGGSPVFVGVDVPQPLP